MPSWYNRKTMGALGALFSVAYLGGAVMMARIGNFEAAAGFGTTTVAILAWMGITQLSQPMLKNTVVATLGAFVFLLALGACFLGFGAYFLFTAVHKREAWNASSHFVAFISWCMAAKWCFFTAARVHCLRSQAMVDPTVSGKSVPLIAGGECGCPHYAAVAVNDTE